jgi:ribosome-associated translation inhibitor RaiA
MRINITGDDSISDQARTYAEYRLFAALSRVLDTSRVRDASLVMRRANSTRHCDGVVCTVTVVMDDGEVRRLRTFGSHPYAAINRAVERFGINATPDRHDSSVPAMAAAE